MGMKMKGLVLTVAAAQFAGLGVAARAVHPSTPPTETGSGFWDAVACGACVATGIVAVSSGAAEAAAVTVLVTGGEAAVGIAAGVSACIDACYHAFAD